MVVDVHTSFSLFYYLLPSIVKVIFSFLSSCSKTKLYFPSGECRFSAAYPTIATAQNKIAIKKLLVSIILAFFFHLFSGFQTVKLFSRGQYGTYTNAPFVMYEYTNGIIRHLE